MTPFSVALNVKMGPGLLTAEVISLLVSLFTILAKLRTPVVVEGRTTLELKHVVHNYIREGIMVDLFGLIPFNPLLGAVYPFNEVKEMGALVTLGCFRVLRVLNAWKMLSLLDEFTIYFNTASYYIILIKAIVVWFIQGHLMGTFWYFVVNICERDWENTWKKNQGL
jgi:hypothetical protein